MDNNDIRGFDLKVENLKLQLINLINEYDLPISVTRLLIQELLYEIERMHKKIVDEQYKRFCENAQKQNETKEEEENSSSSND